ncbi:hypothetical protein [Oceanimonas marisflavi]|uniref:hypothetical protein n=1 Tax=Oceanimonas marisflavi TaxID=2059724 RepID=UPI00130051CB|nr:hypothetical protein [Oceanimonas marisflavi]
MAVLPAIAPAALTLVKIPAAERIKQSKYLILFFALIFTMMKPCFSGNQGQARARK